MGAEAHSMPVSAKALCRIVSFTAAKTSRIFEVSVACVRLELASAALNSWSGQWIFTY